MPVVSEQQQTKDERALAKVLIVLNICLIAFLFTVSYLQR
jgi:hypothetical protein